MVVVLYSICTLHHDVGVVVLYLLRYSYQRNYCFFPLYEKIRHSSEPLVLWDEPGLFFCCLWK